MIMVIKIITTLLSGLLWGCALSFIVTPLFCLFKRKIFHVPIVRNILVKIATRKGHIVTSKLGANINTIPTRMRPGQENGIYTYEYNGRTYTYTVNYSTEKLPYELTLYFIKNPSKAKSVKKIGIGETVKFRIWWKYYFVITIILALVIFAYKMNLI